VLLLTHRRQYIECKGSFDFMPAAECVQSIGQKLEMLKTHFMISSVAMYLTRTEFTNTEQAQRQ